MASSERNCNTNPKPWYKKWWGLILLVAWFPITIPWLIWKKTAWNKGVKVMVIIVFLLLLGAVARNGDKNAVQSDKPVENKQPSLAGQKLKGVEGLKLITSQDKLIEVIKNDNNYLKWKELDDGLAKAHDAKSLREICDKAVATGWLDKEIPGPLLDDLDAKTKSGNVSVKQFADCKDTVKNWFNVLCKSTAWKKALFQDCYEYESASLANYAELRKTIIANGFTNEFAYKEGDIGDAYGLYGMKRVVFSDKPTNGKMACVVYYPDGRVTQIIIPVSKTVKIYKSNYSFISYEDWCSLFAGDFWKPEGYYHNILNSFAKPDFQQAIEIEMNKISKLTPTEIFDKNQAPGKEKGKVPLGWRITKEVAGQSVCFEVSMANSSLVSVSSKEFELMKKISDEYIDR